MARLKAYMFISGRFNSKNKSLRRHYTISVGSNLLIDKADVKKLEILLA